MHILYDTVSFSYELKSSLEQVVFIVLPATVADPEGVSEVSIETPFQLNYSMAYIPPAETAGSELHHDLGL